MKSNGGGREWVYVHEQEHRCEMGTRKNGLGRSGAKDVGAFFVIQIYLKSSTD